MRLSLKFAALGAATYLTAACAVCHAQVASTGSGQAWPNKPIRMLVGFPPGGPTDVAARLVSDKVSTQIGQRIVIETAQARPATSPSRS